MSLPPGCPLHCPQALPGCSKLPHLLEVQSARKRGCHTDLLFSQGDFKPSVLVASSEVSVRGQGLPLQLSSFVVNHSSACGGPPSVLGTISSFLSFLFFWNEGQFRRKEFSQSTHFQVQNSKCHEENVSSS